MAQLLFESVPVSKVSTVHTNENATVLTVHRMLDPHLITQPEAGSVLDDSDVFQCGKCKKQFSSIDIFVNHKTECNNSIAQISDVTLPSNICSIPQNAVVVRKFQIPSLANYSQNLILTETDILQLSAAALDSNATTTVTSHPSIQISPSHTVVHQPSYDSQTIPSHIHQVLQHIPSQDPQQPQTVELSILNDKFISRPLILTSQQHGNSVQSLVLNISNSPQPQTIICNNSESDKSIVNIEPMSEAPETLNEDMPAVNEKEPSTVNIITEFHSSMVKSKKQSSETEVEDNQMKKDHKLNCAYCWKSFTKNFDLQQHIRSHTGEKPFQCIVCGRAFAQKSNVKKHMQTHKVWPDGLARTLPPLPLKSNSMSSEDAAQDLNIPDNPIADSENEFEKSKSVEFNKSSYVCPYCKYVCKSYYKLKSHMKQHDTEKVYKCILSSCGQMFNDLDPFLEHTRSHENEMTYRCRECNKNFASLYDLGSHQATHNLYPNEKSETTQKFFQCNLCLNKYKTPAALDHHLSTSTHTYACSLCDKVFPCERYLRRHLQIHSEAESFTCDICGKGFRTEGYLKVHMLVHSEEKPYECTTCKAAFNRKDKLKRHSLIHEPVKRYKCPFRTHCGCPKEFNRPDKLKSHILTHSCIKPFSCKICGRTFTRKAHLRDHVKQNHFEEDLKLLDDGEMSDKNNSAKSMSDCDNEKSHKCKKVLNRKRKCFARNYRQNRPKRKITQRNGDITLKKIQKRSRDLLKLLDIDEHLKDHDIDCVSDLTDDIPTAHIEIISAHGTLVSSSDLTHMSLESGMIYDLQFETNVDGTDVPNGSPVIVEVMPSSNSNSLLGNELNASSDIGDFS